MTILEEILLARSSANGYPHFAICADCEEKRLIRPDGKCEKCGGRQYMHQQQKGTKR